MVSSEIEDLSIGLLNAFQYSTSLIYFLLLAANIICKSFFLSVKDIHNSMLNILAVASFFLDASFFSVFYLLGRSKHLEFVGFVVLI
jgi:hypothetical protein